MLDTMPKLRREIGLWGAASVGIANIIGAGVFVLSGVAAGLAGPSVILSFLLAGVVAMLTALSSAELASFITETGASYAFTKRAFGRFWSFLVGWFKYFDYIIGAAAVSIGFAAYFTVLFGLSGPAPVIMAAVALPIVFTLINVFSAKRTTHTAGVMVMIKIFALALLVMFGGFFLAQHFNVANYTPFFPNGLGGMFSGAAIIFFAFIGFNTVTMMSEETKDPKRTIPKALMLAFGVSFVLYMAVAAIEIGVLDWRALGLSASPLADLAAAVSGNVLFLDFISFSALIATGSVVLSSIVGGTRASFAMGRDGLLPHRLSYVSERFGTPYVSVLVGGIAVALISGLFFNSLDTIASIFNFGTLFTFLFINLSLIKLRKSEPHTGRLFRTPLYPAVPILGAISCILFMFYLSDTAKVASLVWVFVGAFIYLVMRRRNRAMGRI